MFWMIMTFIVGTMALELGSVASADPQSIMTFSNFNTLDNVDSVWGFWRIIPFGIGMLLQLVAFMTFSVSGVPAMVSFIILAFVGLPMSITIFYLILSAFTLLQ